MSAVRRVGALTGSVFLALGVAFATQAAANASDATSVPCPQTTTSTAAGSSRTATASGAATAGCTPLNLVRASADGQLDPPVDLPTCGILGLPACPDPTTPDPGAPCDPTQVPDCATTPPVDVTTPPVDVTTPPVDVTTPPVDVTTPPVDVTTPPVDVTTPPVSTPTPPVVTPPSATGGNGTPGTPGAGGPTRTVTAPTGGVGRDNAGVDAGLGQNCSGLLCADASYRDRLAAEQRARAARAVQQRPAAAAIPAATQLARTGSELTSTATLAGGLLLVGGTLLLVRRRFAAGYDRRH